MRVTPFGAVGGTLLRRLCGATPLVNSASTRLTPKELWTPMTVKRRHSAARLGVLLVKALLISWALVFLAEHFGWHLVREAGG